MKRYEFQVQDGGKPFVFFDCKNKKQALERAKQWEKEVGRKLKLVKIKIGDYPFYGYCRIEKSSSLSENSPNTTGEEK